MNGRSARWFLVVSILSTLMPAVARAQAVSTGSIAGVVRDKSGAVLPGVTVEASSPALIEKVRTAVTNGEGRYTIVDLRPGSYTVNFALAGFSTLRREGIVISTGFAATVNADLAVGAIEETITVTGASPIVDTQSTRQQKVVSDELLATLPSGTKGYTGIARLVPGMSGGADVGGAVGIYGSNSVFGATIHGKGGAKLSYDGMITNNLGAAGSMSYIPNPATVQETVVEVGGISAESDSSGILLNLVPKEGANAFRLHADATYTNEGLQGDNLTDELKQRGLTSVNKVDHIYDANVAQGGPVSRDHLWYFVATRASGSQTLVPGVYFNKTQGTPFYTADTDRPAYRKEWLKSLGGRVTWQASERNKFNVFADVQSFQVRGFTSGELQSPEAYHNWSFWPVGLYQVSWSSPHSNRLLLDAAVSLAQNGFPVRRETPADIGITVKPTDIAIREASTGLQYNAKAYYYYTNQQDRYSGRFSASYVPGSHAFKVGGQFQWMVFNQDYVVNDSLQYTFNRGAPSQITQWALPSVYKYREKADVGLYAQDKWTVGRLTLNYGVRFEYLNGYIPATNLPAGRFAGARNFPTVNRMPDWSDLNPRVGGAFDVFGNGRTALKASVGRYVGKMATAIGILGNPLSTSINSATRTWNDQFFGAGDPRSGNYVPDCDLNNFTANAECGLLGSVFFGQNNPAALRYDDDLLRGFGVRDYFWDTTAEVQHQLTPRLAITGGYYRNWSNHFDLSPGSIVGGVLGSGVSDNLSLTPADFSPYCVTAPKDPRLPGGGGYQVCGLYDIAPAKFGQGQQVVRRPSNYGDGNSRTSDFFTVSGNARLLNGVEYGAALDTGRTVVDQCFVVDSPQALLNCRVVTPFSAQTQVKMYVNYRLPYGLVVSGVLQSLSGIPHLATYTATNAEAVSTLGRNLGACGASATCNATVTVPLLVPQTDFEPRRNLLDFRTSKEFALAGQRKLRAQIDVYNVTNSSSVVSVNNAFGSSWLRPLNTVNARLIQFGAQLSF